MTRRRSLILSIVAAGCWITLLAILFLRLATSPNRSEARIGKVLRVDDQRSRDAMPHPISVNDPPNELAETEIEKIPAVKNVR
jgi:hypothetical protein